MITDDGDLGARWLRLCDALDIAPDRAMFDALVRAYAEPWRAYHTREHLRECLTWLDRVRPLADDVALLEIAVWFHDAVYRPSHEDNERRSAEWAAGWLRANGIDERRVQRVRDAILATRHDTNVTDPDQQLLLDIDLAILGAPPARFREYEREVRREHAHVSEADFRHGRSALLERFLARPRIYTTDFFHDRLESHARRNLRDALRHLKNVGMN